MIGMSNCNVGCGTVALDTENATSMSVTIRLSRHGAKKKPFYRIVVTDHRAPRDGRHIENMKQFGVPAVVASGASLSGQSP